MTDNITLPRATVQQALEAIDLYQRNEHCEDELLIAGHFLRTALEQQQAEPVATHRITAWGHCGVCRHDRIPGEGCARQECPDSPQQQAEPVAWVCYGNVSDEKHAVDYQQEDIDAISVGTMLYTAPPQRKPLTDEAIEQAQRAVWRSLPSDFDYTTSSWIEIGIRYAEAAHGIKEGT